ncbi:acyl-CoA dehydrogenase family protein [Dyella sp. GSA-30]|uniref:acyl-CoA dehydrogenase family protein n=1 Tax=Dyella sp. GSA-30 TaxID=2994496 RepID=UPI002492A161|nr:acyl-CoA dehydrogenase family protein [Dyella sp. GSA-30]BDU21612.1 acyl-CoA dehydrogenase [Dyella sp. GSA-30]
MFPADWIDLLNEIEAASGAADSEQALAPGLVHHLRRSGLLGATVPKEHGGFDWGASQIGRLHYELGRRCTSTRAIVTAHQLVVEVLCRWGTPSQNSRWQRRFADGTALAAFALSEEDAGANPERICASAVADGPGFRLSAKKRWITGARIADAILVAACVDGQPTAFLVELPNPCITIRPIHDLLGLRGAMVAEVEFRDVPVSPEAVVGPIGSGLLAMVGTGLDLGRFVTAWGATGIQAQCYRIVREFMFRPDASGRRRIDHQLVRRLMAEMMVNLRSSELLCKHAAELRDCRSPESVGAGMLAKYACAKAAAASTRNAVEALGALGCSSATPVARFFRDAKVLEIIEGTNEVLEDVMGTFWHECCET